MAHTAKCMTDFPNHPGLLFVSVSWSTLRTVHVFWSTAMTQICGYPHMASGFQTYSALVWSNEAWRQRSFGLARVHINEVLDEWWSTVCTEEWTRLGFSALFTASAWIMSRCWRSKSSYIHPDFQAFLQIACCNLELSSSVIWTCVRFCILGNQFCFITSCSLVYIDCNTDLLLLEHLGTRSCKPLWEVSWVYEVKEHSSMKSVYLNF